MAIGDDALAAGIPLMTGAELANTLDTEMNLTRDEIARRAPITVTPGTSIRQAAQVMTAPYALIRINSKKEIIIK